MSGGAMLSNALKLCHGVRGGDITETDNNLNARFLMRVKVTK